MASRLAIGRLCTGELPVEWAHVVGALTAALQEERFATEFGYGVRPLPGSAIWQVVVEIEEGEVGSLSAALAVVITAAVAAGEVEADELSLARRMAAFDAERSRVRLDWTSRVLADEARARGIPVAKLVPNHSLAVIGQGHWRRRFRGTSADSTSYRASRISQDKYLTARLLAAAFVPVPQQYLVRSPADLDIAVAEIGFPLVVKGRSIDKGAAVTTGIEFEGAACRRDRQGYRPS